MFPWLPVRFLVRDDFDSLAWAAQVRCPTLVVHGDADRIVPLADGRRLAKTIPGAQLVVIPGGSHDPRVLYHSEGTAVSEFFRRK